MSVFVGIVGSLCVFVCAFVCVYVHVFVPKFACTRLSAHVWENLQAVWKHVHVLLQ